MENPLDFGRQQEIIDLRERGIEYCEDCGIIHKEGECDDEKTSTKTA